MERSRDEGSPEERSVESIVLAGGFSRRFGDREKLTARIAEQPMVRRVARTVAPLSGRIVVSCRREQREQLAAALGVDDASAIEGDATATSLEVPVSFAFDDRPDGGPLAGLASAAAAVGDETEAVLVIGGDFPLVPTAAFETLCGKLGEADVAVPSIDDRLQPLCAVWRAEALEAGIATVDDPHDRAVLAAFDPVVVREIPAERLPGGESSFRNVNTPAQLREISREIGSDGVATTGGTE